MKFAVNKEQIIEGLQKAAGIIPAKAGAAYLRSIWLRAENMRISIMSTDANIEFTGTYPAEVFDDGLIGVQGRAFVDLTRQLPSGVIQFSLDDSGANMLLEQGRRNYRLPVNSSEWFQNFSAFPEGEAITWSGDMLLEILERVTFCINDDDAQDAIACLYFKPCGKGRVDVCGLNGHQFAMYTFYNDDLCQKFPEKGILIQKKYLQDIKKWLGGDEIELNMTEKRLYFRRLDGAEMLSLPRALYEYPDYNVFMSKLDGDNLSILTLPRKEAIEALGRIQVFNTESERCVFFDLGEKEVSLSVQGADVGSARENIEVSYKGELSRIAFPTKNLMEILSHFSSENVDMIFTGSEGPCGINGSSDPNYTVVIMPMKVSEKSYYDEIEG